MLHRNYGINPKELNDDEWLALYAEYQFTEKIKYENNVLAFKQALIEVLNAAFGKDE